MKEIDVGNLPVDSKDEILEYARDVQQELKKVYDLDFGSGASSDNGGSVPDAYTEHVFTDSLQKENPGLIYPCTGTVAMIYPAIFLEDFDLDERSKEIIISELEGILDYVEENGFNVQPHGPRLDVFKPSEENPLDEMDYHYVGSLAWVLSLCTFARFAEREEILDLSVELSEKIKSKIHLILRELFEAFVHQGDEGGWGFTKDVKEPSIYFTWSVMETFSDVGDLLLGKEDYIGKEESAENIPDITPDDELFEELYAEANKSLFEEDTETSEDSDAETYKEWLKTKTDESREKVSHWLYENYISDISDFNETLDIDSLQKSDFRHESNKLYYNYFIIITAINSFADHFLETSEEDLRVRRELEHAVYATRIQFLNAKEEYKDEWFEDEWKSVLEVELGELKEDASIEISKRNLKDVQIEEPTIIPLALRTNIYFSFYISDGSDKKNDELFKMLYLNQNRDINGRKDQLWDSDDYVLPITERSIEGIVDYFDYLGKFRNAQEELKSLKEKIDSGELLSSEEANIGEVLESNIERLVEEKINSKLSPSGQESVESGDQDFSPKSDGDSLNQLTKLFQQAASLDSDDKDKKRFMATFADLVYDAVVYRLTRDKSSDAEAQFILAEVQDALVNASQLLNADEAFKGELKNLFEEAIEEELDL